MYYSSTFISFLHYIASISDYCAANSYSSGQFHCQPLSADLLWIFQEYLSTHFFVCKVYDSQCSRWLLREHIPVTEGKEGELERKRMLHYDRTPTVLQEVNLLVPFSLSFPLFFYYF